MIENILRGDKKDSPRKPNLVFSKRLFGIFENQIRFLKEVNELFRAIMRLFCTNIAVIRSIQS
ncbi:MAG: hypothetical protein ACRCS7_04960, partial [Tannerellaceae bacterium]